MGDKRTYWAVGFIPTCYFCSVISLPTLSYKDSGVDICAGDAMVQQIKPLAKATHRPGVIGGLGGFGGLFRLNDVCVFFLFWCLLLSSLLFTLG